ncbi:uncharacterized protein TRUGW13939_01534 [Talaromyces rugulosus]|uniref:2,5-diamino-6-ribosylamino-4(3H)-pyrimidinone 5'-phosphate reductase n=1 Tax=Talaromyces rugulosus TaxID=121627 RepID=A0A7H8QKQ4_TALRU|nr:uncharacterized protein TRUGW13939_01534 [Talaromyces rugulosus]QKX54448.1 hypothetical protein TRUGW13939_01534 [Talaromyces rugulosus]
MSGSLPPDALHFPASARPFLEPYLPPLSQQEPTPANIDRQNARSRPFTTLTFATSLDSALSLAPGVRTALSGPQSKAMTHYLRSRHQAILIGVGTANADDPGLNCRIAGTDGYKPKTGDESPKPDPVIRTLATKAHSSDPELKQLMKAVAMGQATSEQLQAFQVHIDEAQAVKDTELLASVRGSQGILQQPRPIVIDPNARWEFYENSKIFSLVRQSKGKAPFVIISKNCTPSQNKKELLEKHGGKFIPIETVPSENGHPRFNWNDILHLLATQENIQSIMIEGGGSIINSILSEPEYSAAVDSVIVTIAPTWLGQGGVVVSPQRRVDASGYPIPASRLTDVRWHPFGEDVVLLGRLLKSPYTDVI